MLAELSRREKEANIKPDPDVDIYMKVSCVTHIRNLDMKIELLIVLLLYSCRQQLQKVKKQA